MSHIYKLEFFHDKKIRVIWVTVGKFRILVTQKKKFGLLVSQWV